MKNSGKKHLKKENQRENSEWRIVYLKRACKDLYLIDSSSRERVLHAINEKLSKNPARYSQGLSGVLTGHYKFRVGDYRVIFSIERPLIIILLISHRKNAYDKFEALL